MKKDEGTEWGDDICGRGREDSGPIGENMAI